MSKPTYEELEQRIQELEQTEIRQKKAEKALQYKRAVESSLDLVVEFDRNYTYLFANKGYLKYHQLNEEQIIGHSFGEVIGEDYFENNIKPYFDKCLNGETVNFETAYTYRGKGKCHMEVWYYPRIEEDGQIRGVVALSRDITERKRAEKKLRESELKFKLIAENIKDVFWMSTCGVEKMVYISPGYDILWEKSREDLYEIPKSFIKAIHPDDLNGYHGMIDKYHKKGKPYECEYRIIRGNGEVRWIHEKGYPVTESLDGSHLMTGLCTDITERKRVEEVLREKEEQLRLLIHRIQAAVVVHGADTQIVASNPKAQELLGLTEEQMLGKTTNDKIWKFLNADGNEMPFEEYPVNRVLATQQPLRDLTAGVYRSEKNDLAWVLVNANPVFDDKHNIQQVIVTFVDITKRKQAEELLQQYKRAVESSLDLIAAVDRDYTYLLANKSYLEHHQLNEEQVIGHYFGEVVGEDYFKNNLKHHMDRCLDGETLHFETAYTYKERGKCHLEAWYNPLVDENGKAQGVVGIARDITDRKQAEEEKRMALEFAAEQSRHALIGQVAGKMAHDFNNVLMGIMGNAQLAIMDCDDKNIKVKLEHINEFSLRGRDITNTLMSYSKDQEPKQTIFKIEDKIDLVLKMLEKDLTNIEISRNYKPGTPGLLADPGMIQDALVNIIQNSIHAMSKVENPILNLKAYSQDDKVFIEIEDNGCGIPKEHQDSIYTPSFTLKGSHDETVSYESGIKGTGYGLSNVKKYIVEKHKGDIFLESEMGKGTKITVALRIIKDHLSSDEKKEVVKSQIYDKRRILLVEDEPAIADVQYKILTKEPFSHIVSIAANGQAAIDAFDRTKFDVVSLDYILPGNINGLDVYNHIRKNDKDIPIMFISGNIEFLESMKELKEKDSNLEYLSKPIDNLDYVNKINELVGSSS